MNRREFITGTFATLSVADQLRFERAQQRISVMDQIWLAPWVLMGTPDGHGMRAAEWQKDALSQIVTQKRNSLLNCCRGAGKSETVARGACAEAYLGGYVLVVSPSDRQSIKFFNHVRYTHRNWNLVPQVSEPTKHELFLSNGGRVEAVPSREETLRAIHGVTLLVLDEASRIPDQLYAAVLPMLAPGGRIVALSTPNGQRGFFHKEWSGDGRSDWTKHLVLPDRCPWITPQMIEDYRRSTNELMTRQEYGCEFVSLSSCPFDIDAMMELERRDTDITWS